MAGDALRAALPAGWIVRGQNPLALDDESAPEKGCYVKVGYRRASPRAVFRRKPLIRRKCRRFPVTSSRS